MNPLLENVEQRIQKSMTYEDLRQLRDILQNELHERLLFSSIADWVLMVNEVHDRIILRTVELAEVKQPIDGWKKAPSKYAFILFGSGGRSEQTLWSDQDNGLVYMSSSDSNEDYNRYYSQFAQAIEDGLKIVGYPPCEGGVVASNHQWCKSIEDWETTMEEWFHDASWESIRQVLIIADSRCLYGDQTLVHRMKLKIDMLIEQMPDSLTALLKNTLRHKVVLGPFGNLIREPYGEDAGGFDIKYGAYIPFVNAIRLLCLKNHIHATSTLERLSLLSAYIGEDQIEPWRRAFEYILWLRSITAHQLEDGYYSSRGKLSELDLNKEVASKLKECLHVGEQLQKYIRRTI